MIQDPILYLVAVSPPVSDHSISPRLSTFRIFWQEGHRVPWMNEDALVGTSDWDIPDVIVCLNPGSLTLVAWQSATFLLPHSKLTVLSFVTGKYPATFVLGPSLMWWCVSRSSPGELGHGCLWWKPEVSMPLPSVLGWMILGTIPLASWEALGNVAALTPSVTSVTCSHLMSLSQALLWKEPTWRPHSQW